MNKLEEQVLQMLLSGDDPVLAVLRQQLAHVTQSKTEFTGVGFFAYFDVPEQTPHVPGNPSFRFGDVIAEIEGIEHGAGFVLFIDEGLMTILEGYTYDEPWPNELKNFELKYMDRKGRDISALRTTPGWPSALG